MRPVAVIAAAQTRHARRRDDVTPGEMCYPVVREAVRASGLERHAIDYTVAGSADVLEGRPFSFGFALDYTGAVPPIEESHLEMDGIWAAYDAWVRIQAGAAETALVVGWGKSSEGSLAHVLNATLDPFYEAPLGVDAVGLAALQAQAFLDSGAGRVEDLAGVVAAARTAAARNPYAQERDPITVEEALASPLVAGPLHRLFLPPISDGACAVVLAAGEAVERSGLGVLAWIAGVAHAAEAGGVGSRDLLDGSSLRAAAEPAAEMAGWSAVEAAELAAPFPHQEIMIRRALGLGGAAINPSGGPLGANPIMATGLVRLAEAAIQAAGRGGERQVPDVRRALAHGTSGHLLQSNIVWLLEGEGSPVP